MLLTIPTLVLIGILIAVLIAVILTVLLIAAAHARAQREEVIETNDPSMPEDE